MVSPVPIGVPRFELGTSPTRTERATRLRHTPSAAYRLATLLAPIRDDSPSTVVIIDNGGGGFERRGADRKPRNGRRATRRRARQESGELPARGRPLGEGCRRRLRQRLDLGPPGGGV